MFLGSSICRSWLAIASIITCALSKLAHINRCEFLSSSHIRCWVLKSPNHTMWWGSLDLLARAIFLMYCVTFLAPSGFFPSLYIFISRTCPNGVCTWTAVTSDEAMSICAQLLVGILLFMSSNDQVLSGLA